ncbi:hypothetical protein F5Y14DRAFT_172724 [Nemania sp. NC0429]|nr:hypothetical protein F5Y14DRAFT_172724 [Nemania sp. NC0429]
MLESGLRVCSRLRIYACLSTNLLLSVNLLLSLNLLLSTSLLLLRTSSCDELRILSSCDGSTPITNLLLFTSFLLRRIYSYYEFTSVYELTPVPAYEFTLATNFLLLQIYSWLRVYSCDEFPSATNFLLRRISFCLQIYSCLRIFPYFEYTPVHQFTPTSFFVLRISSYYESIPGYEFTPATNCLLLRSRRYLHSETIRCRFPTLLSTTMGKVSRFVSPRDPFRIPSYILPLEQANNTDRDQTVRRRTRRSVPYSASYVYSIYHHLTFIKNRNITMGISVMNKS